MVICFIDNLEISSDIFFDFSKLDLSLDFESIFFSFSKVSFLVINFLLLLSKLLNLSVSRIKFLSISFFFVNF